VACGRRKSVDGASAGAKPSRDGLACFGDVGFVVVMKPNCSNMLIVVGFGLVFAEESVGSGALVVAKVSFATTTSSGRFDCTNVSDTSVVSSATADSVMGTSSVVVCCLPLKLI